MKLETILWLAVAIGIVYVIVRHKDFASCVSMAGTNYANYSTDSSAGSLIG